MNPLLRIYKERTLSWTDMIEHMETLTMFASRCMSVVEFGLRTGNSTIAILRGLPRTYIGVEICEFAHKAAFEEACAANGINAQFWDHTDDLKVEIPPCDMLMIDTEHTNEQLSNELRLHGNKARKYILFHDTWLTNDCSDGAGLRMAIDEFIENNSEWHVMAHYYNGYGLTVLTRINPQDWPEHMALREPLSRR